MKKKDAKKRLEKIRKSLRDENISYSELDELQNLTEYIEDDDVELLESAGVPEGMTGKEWAKKNAKVDYDDMIEIFPLDKNGDNIKLF